MNEHSTVIDLRDEHRPFPVLDPEVSHCVDFESGFTLEQEVVDLVRAGIIYS